MISDKESYKYYVEQDLKAHKLFWYHTFSEARFSQTPAFPFRSISFQPIPLRSASCLRLGSRTRTCAWSAHFASLRSAFACRCLLMYYNSFFSRSLCPSLLALRSRGDLIILPYFFPFVNPHFCPFFRFYALHKTSRVTRIKSRQFALGHPPYTGMNRLYTSPQLPI